MKRFSVFSLSAMVLGLVLLPGSSVAQQKSLKEQLVGAWELVSCGRGAANGATQPYCVNSIGILMFDASGDTLPTAKALLDSAARLWFP